MEILYYTVTAVVLYLLADWLLDRIEIAYGRRFKLRSLIFLVIMLVLALCVSQIARLFF
jgi:MFS family permease